MQIRRLHKRRERRPSCRIGLHAQRRAQMDFAEAQTGLHKTIERCARLFEFYAKVATIVIYAHAMQQAVALNGCIARAPSVEKIQAHVHPC